MVCHEVRTRRAVQSQRQDFDTSERGAKGFDILAGEHGSHGLDSYRDHQRNRLADFVAQFLHRQDAGLDVTSVLASFENKQIGATLDKSTCLLKEAPAQLIKRDAAGDADGLGSWTHGASDKARFR